MTARAPARYAGCLTSIVPPDSEACSWNPESTPKVDSMWPVERKGEPLNGTPWATTSARDEMFVLNVWDPWRAPCIAEAPGLQWVWEGPQGADFRVQFVRADFREEPARGAAFTAKCWYHLSSLRDESAVLILDLQGKAPTVHTALQFDTERRGATHVIGPVCATTLRGLAAS